MPKADFLLPLLAGCGSAALPAAQGPAPCSPPGWAASTPSSSQSLELELRLRPLPTDSGGAVAVSVVVIAAEARLSTLRLPAGLRRPLQLHVSRERPVCDPVTGR